jgi:hypothetical protein
VSNSDLDARVILDTNQSKYTYFSYCTNNTKITKNMKEELFEKTGARFQV